MARATLPEAKLFKEIIDALGNISDEVSVNLAPDGIYIKAMDVDQSSLIDAFIPKEMFLEYEVDEPTNIGISVSNLKKILKHVKKGENLSIEPLGDFVKYSIGAMGIISSSFKFRNLDVPVPEIPELSLNFTVNAKLHAQSFKKAVEDIESAGGSTQIKATQDMLLFKSIGAGKVESKFPVGSFALISLEVVEPAESIYDTMKLVNILGLAKVSDVVTLQFASKMPLRIDFSVGLGRITYILAPFEIG